MKLFALLFFIHVAFSKFYFVEWHAESTCNSKYAIWTGWIGKDYSCVPSGERGSITSACEGNTLILISDAITRKCETYDSVSLTADNQCREGGSAWYKAMCVAEKADLPDQETQLFGTEYYLNEECDSAPAALTAYLADTCLKDTYFECSTNKIYTWNTTLDCVGADQNTYAMNPECTAGVRTGACLTIGGDLTSVSSTLIASAMLSFGVALAF